MIATGAEEQILICAARPLLDAAAGERLQQLLRSDLDWDHLLHLAERHCIVPLICRQLNSISVFAIPGNVSRQTENLAFVAIDKLFKRRGVAFFCGGYEQVLVLACDGRRQSVWISGAQEIANP